MNPVPSAGGPEPVKPGEPLTSVPPNPSPQAPRLQEPTIEFRQDKGDNIAAAGTETASCKVGTADPLIIGEYRVVGVLSYTSMSAVYRGWCSPLQRLVALKLLTNVELRDPQRGDFIEEAAITARLRHPGIVQLYHVIEHESRPCLVLEYVEGGTLHQQTAGVGLSDFRSIAQIMLQLAEAVQFAHGLGVLHLDLKPSNVLLTAAGQPKIGDFGLAKLQGSAGSTLAGTPHYMAPEQTMSRGVIGIWTDIYGLGTILYQMLTGQPPCLGNTLEETLAAVRVGAIVPIQQIRPDAPHELVAICNKCLHLTPGGRYTSASEVREDLQRFLAGLALQIPVAEIAYRFRLWLRHPARIRDAGLVLTFMSAGFGVWCLLGLFCLAVDILPAPNKPALTKHILTWLLGGYLPGLLLGLFTIKHRLWAVWAGTLLTATGVAVMIAHLLGLYYPDYNMGGLAPNAASLLVANLLITTLFAIAFLTCLPALCAWYCLYRPKSSASKPG